jgi:hypothetical protein
VFGAHAQEHRRCHWAGVVGPVRGGECGTQIAEPQDTTAGKYWTKFPRSAGDATRIRLGESVFSLGSRSVATRGTMTFASTWRRLM